MSEAAAPGEVVDGWPKVGQWPERIYFRFGWRDADTHRPITDAADYYSGWVPRVRPLEPDAPEPVRIPAPPERVRTMIRAAAAFAVEQGTGMQEFQAMAGAAHAVATKRAQKAKGEQS